MNSLKLFLIVIVSTLSLTSHSQEVAEFHLTKKEEICSESFEKCFTISFICSKQSLVSDQECPTKEVISTEKCISEAFKCANKPNTTGISAFKDHLDLIKQKASNSICLKEYGRCTDYLKNCVGQLNLVPLCQDQVSKNKFNNYTLSKCRAELYQCVLPPNSDQD